ncbi:MAG: hypothetical protein B7X04_02310 [Parcubacteria group bacterium 21-54-25]|nr:MAG: hypothetical protein B7X04_02310 [Parcubacteria group bacterium 21-54-25]HQU07881.1 dockerin type I domain-containing protein [Candidatus Paceibacterota bacterium]
MKQISRALVLPVLFLAFATPAFAATNTPTDYDIMSACFGQTPTAGSVCAKADFDGDGIVNIADLAAFKSAIKYDINGDGAVDLSPNGADAAALQACFGQTPTAGSPCAKADLNGDGMVNFADLSAFKAASKYDLNGDGEITFNNTSAPVITNIVNDATPNVNVTISGTNFDPASNTVTIGGTSRNLPSFNGTNINFQMTDFGLSAGSYSVQVTTSAGASNVYQATITNSPASTGLKIALLPTSPNGTTLFQGQSGADLADFVFSNPSSVPITVTSLAFNRIGASSDSAMTNVYLSHSGTRVTGSSGVYNSQFSFTDGAGLFTVPAGGTYSVSVLSDIANSASSGQQIGVALASVGSFGAIDPSVNFPINAGYQTISTQTPAPAITSVSPTSGSTNTAVTLYGTNLQGATQVRFYNTSGQFVASQNVTSVSSDGTHVTFIISGVFMGMEGAGSYQINVQSPNGTTNSEPFTVTSESIPTITSTSAKAAGTFQADAGGGLQVFGTGFSSGATAYINGAPVTTTYVSSTELGVNVPTSLSAGASYPMYVTGGGGTSNTVQIQILSNLANYPHITSTSAKAAGTFQADAGGVLQISGTNFSGATAVYIGGEQATITSNTGTSILIDVPSNLSAGVSYPLFVTGPTTGVSNTVQIQILSVLNSTPTITFAQVPAENNNVLHPGEPARVFGANLDQAGSIPVEVRFIAAGATVYSADVPGTVNADGTQVSFTVPSLSNGTYSLLVYARTSFGTNQISVSVTSPATGRIIPSTTFMNFHVVQGQSNPPPVPMTLTNAGSVPVDYTLNVPNQPAWLNTSYSTNTLTLAAGGVVELEASVDATQVNAPGTYTATLVVSGNFSGSPLSIPVTLTIDAAQNSSTPTPSTNENTPPTSNTNTPAGPFTQNLWRGQHGEEVVQLQQLLNRDPNTQIADSGPGSPGEENGYYGYLTQSAVQNFQCKYNIVCSGSPDATGYGVVGPQTRDELNMLYDQQGSSAAAGAQATNNVGNSSGTNGAQTNNTTSASSPAPTAAQLQTQLQQLLQLVLQLQQQLARQQASPN